MARMGEHSLQREPHSAFLARARQMIRFLMFYMGSIVLLSINDSRKQEALLSSWMLTRKQSTTLKTVNSWHQRTGFS